MLTWAGYFAAHGLKQYLKGVGHSRGRRISPAQAGEAAAGWGDGVGLPLTNRGSESAGGGLPVVVGQSRGGLGAGARDYSGGEAARLELSAYNVTRVVLKPKWCGRCPECGPASAWSEWPAAWQGQEVD